MSKLVHALTEDDCPGSDSSYLKIMDQLGSAGYEVDCPGSGGVYTISRTNEAPPEDGSGNMMTLFAGSADPTYKDHNLNLVKTVAGPDWERDQEILLALVDNLWNTQVPDSPEY